MEDLKKQAKSLIEQANADEMRKYNSDWKSQAVATYNEFCEEINYMDDMIYELESDEFEDIVKWNLEQRGAIGVKILLDGVENTQDYVKLDAYGNAESVDYDLVDKLEEILDY